MSNFSFFVFLKKGRKQTIRISLSMLLLLTFNFAWANTNSDNYKLDSHVSPSIMMNDTLNLSANITQAVCNLDNGSISIDPATYVSYIWNDGGTGPNRTLSLIHISEPTRPY